MSMNVGLRATLRVTVASSYPVSIDTMGFDLCVLSAVRVNNNTAAPTNLT